MGVVGWICGVSLKERQHWTRCRGNWGPGFDVKRHTRVAWTGRKKAQCRLCERMHWVGGGGEGACWQAEEDLVEHSVCQRASDES